jgi:hypothetical protein
MLKILARYEKETPSAEFKDISRQLPTLLVGVSAESRQLWWLNQDLLELRCGYTMYHKMAVVHGALYTIPPRKRTSIIYLASYIRLLWLVIQLPIYQVADDNNFITHLPR